MWARVAAGSLLLLLVPGMARGYCRTRSCDHDDPAAPDACQYDQACADAHPSYARHPLDCCATNGMPIAWPGACVSFSVQEDGSKLRGIASDAFDEVVQGALYKWSHVDCGDGTRPSIGLFDRSPVSCAKVEHTRPGANIWMFRDTGWPHETGAIAITTVSFIPSTGVIVDADVEINSETFEITLGDTNIGYDLDAIVTHEAGHTLGLAETDDRDATMFGYYDAHQVEFRTLAADDIAGICAVYPPTRAVGPCVPEPGDAFQSTCHVPKHRGCALGPPSPGSAGSSLLGLGGLLYAVRRRRSRRAVLCSARCR
jgi:hypothetical protein